MELLTQMYPHVTQPPALTTLHLLDRRPTLRDTVPPLDSDVTPTAFPMTLRPLSDNEAREAIAVYALRSPTAPTVESLPPSLTLRDVPTQVCLLFELPLAPAKHRASKCRPSSLVVFQLSAPRVLPAQQPTWRDGHGMVCHWIGCPAASTSAKDTPPLCVHHREIADTVEEEERPTMVPDKTARSGSTTPVLWRRGDGRCFVSTLRESVAATGDDIRDADRSLLRHSAVCHNLIKGRTSKAVLQKVVGCVGPDMGAKQRHAQETQGVGPGTMAFLVARLPPQVRDLLRDEGGSHAAMVDALHSAVRAAEDEYETLRSGTATLQMRLQDSSVINELVSSQKRMFAEHKGHRLRSAARQRDR